VDAGRLRSQQPIRRIPGRNWTKADVVVYPLDGIELAVKDYAPRPFLVRNTLGRLLIRRETAAYRASEGIAGLLDFLGRVGPFALATRWVDARPLSSLRDRALDDATFDRVDGIVGALHERGVALGDLHHRNVLVGSDGSLYITDLAMALVLGVRPGRWRRYLFERWRDQDRVALARMRARFTGRDEAEAVAAVGRTAAAWYGRGRGVRRVWDRLRGR
jgi:hypothetical protein